MNTLTLKPPNPDHPISQTTHIKPFPRTFKIFEPTAPDAQLIAD